MIQNLVFEAGARGVEDVHPRQMRPAPPDIVLLATEWPTRALIRAQLIEEGFEVAAADSWAMMRRHLWPLVKPQLALVDLKGLRNPVDVLTDLRALMKPDRVLVLRALGTVLETDIERFGYRTVSRPIVIEEIVRAARATIRTATTSQGPPGGMLCG